MMFQYDAIQEKVCLDHFLRKKIIHETLPPSDRKLPPLATDTKELISLPPHPFVPLLSQGLQREAKKYSIQ
jgi:hypothetical protein